jgi:hypothetical protein
VAAQAKYSVLAGYQVLIRKKDQRGRGVFYAAQVGPLARDEATRSNGVLFDDRLECFLGPDPVMRMTRVRTDRKRGHSIDYHHLIGTLRRKPQALRYLVYREALFPSAAYARAWTALDDAMPPRDACRTMVGLLVLASVREAWEIALAARLDAILDPGGLPDLAQLKTEFATRTRRSSEVEIPAPNLDDYNRLLPSAWERRL